VTVIICCATSLRNKEVLSPLNFCRVKHTTMVHIQELTAPNGLKISLPTGLFINNKFVSGSGKPIASINPSNRQEICTVQSASIEDIDHAVEVARHAFHDPSWRSLSSSERGALLYKLADLIDEDKVALATLESWDNGKPYTSALEEDLSEVIATMRYYAGWADKFHGQTMTGLGDGQKFAYTLREPVGVCGQIIPWNYPLCKCYCMHIPINQG
jgi:aldehyde dehydrogenase (NAD+)